MMGGDVRVEIVLVGKSDLNLILDRSFGEILKLSARNFSYLKIKHEF